MKRFHRPFFAFLLSLLLIGSQQAAFAHLLSHTSGKAEAATQYQDDHSALDGVAETCATCLAFAGAGGSAPPSANTLSAVFANADTHFLPPVGPVFIRPTFTQRARAPPATL